MRPQTRRLSRRTFLKESSITVAASSILAAIRPGLLQGVEEGSPRVGVIVLLGPPGAGKSEQGHRLAARYSIPVISTGDLLRDNVKRGTKLGLQADPYMKAGQLVPDSLMNPILEERLSHPDCARGFILDGYPRTPSQAESLDALLKNKGLRWRVFLLDVPTERLVERLSGRRICPHCQRTYNIYSQPPNNDEVCDADGTPLVQRPDDQPEVVRSRLDTYQKQTQPTIDYYDRQGRLVRVNGDQTPDKVATEIESKLASS